MNYFRPLQWIFFQKVFPYSNIYFKFYIWSRLPISNGPSLSSVKRYVLLNSRIQEHDVLATDTCFENSLLLFSCNSLLFYRNDLGKSFFHWDSALTLDSKAVNTTSTSLLFPLEDLILEKVANLPRKWVSSGFPRKRAQEKGYKHGRS